MGLSWRLGKRGYIAPGNGAIDLDAIADFVVQYFNKALNIDDDATAWKIIEA